MARLACLAPGIAAAILEGRQQAELTANGLLRDTRLPIDWSGQRTPPDLAEQRHERRRRAHRRR